MKKYKVYDLYEGKECIGYADTLSEVKKIALLKQDKRTLEVTFDFEKLRHI